MSTVTTIAGQLDAKGLKIAIVATRFNDFIVDRLVGGAQDYLERHGLDTANITMVRIPGAFEMPLICQKLVNSGKYDGVLALGAVIRGGTPHFDYVCSEASKGIAQAMMHSAFPLALACLPATPSSRPLNVPVPRAATRAWKRPLPCWKPSV